MNRNGEILRAYYKSCENRDTYRMLRYDTRFNQRMMEKNIVRSDRPKNSFELIGRQ
jgi:hypothetical protein